MERLGLRYSLSSLEGRLEFIADLVSEAKEGLNAAERRALRAFGQKLRLPQGQVAPFVAFSATYLQQVLLDLESGTAGALAQGIAAQATRPLPKASAAGLLLALALGMLAPAGCAQKKQTKQVLGVAEQPAACALREPLQQTQTYRVEAGDSVRSIARKLGINSLEIVARNNIRYDPLRNWYPLHPGQVLLLPAEPASAPPAEALAVQSGPGTFYLGEMVPEQGYVHHLIKKGQTLVTISKRYQVAVEAIASANNIKDANKIAYGTILRIPLENSPDTQQTVAFASLSRSQKVQFLRERTINAGHPFLETIVDLSEDYRIDPRLYAALIWEESWFDADARSADNCTKLVQLDPRFHAVSQNTAENFRRSLQYLRHEFGYYRQAGFDCKAATICALAAYNGGTTRIRRYIRNGLWDGKCIETIPLKETRDHLCKIAQRCRRNYQASL